ncbi:hypothetical protein CJT84_30570 [Pseudomonas aeruginosa]|nr:hypothetical protein CJT84_30570 [Pseudomonas aeruginosa]
MAFPATQAPVCKLLASASPCVEAASMPINCELMISRPRQRIRCPGERPARDGRVGGSGLCGCGDSEVLHSALLLNRKGKLLKSRRLLKGGGLPAL